MCTSLQSIVNVHDRSRLEKDIQELFKPKIYPRFELKEFYTHHLYQKCEQFHFFLDILEEWNRKIQQREVPNHCETLFQKNAFIFNSLRNTLMQPLPLSQKILARLYHWFNGTRNKNVRPAVKGENQMENLDDDWFVRNTFKSNLPAEIDLYHRRACCRFRKENQEPLVSENIVGKDEEKMRKVKTECWTKEELDRDLQRKRVVKIENEIVRFERQKKELMNVQAKWKKKKHKEEEVGVKNFYRGNFSHNKTYFLKKKHSKENQETFQHYSLKRVKTSMSQRFSKRQTNPNRFSEGGPSCDKKYSQNCFDEFESGEEKKVRDVAGLRLLTNPFETKLKKKKRVK